MQDRIVIFGWQAISSVLNLQSSRAVVCQSILLCKSFSWCASSFVSLGLAATAISLIDQVSVVHLFCFCLSLHGTTIVLDNNKRQLFYKQIEIFMALTQ